MIPVSKEPIKNFYGQIIGWIETDKNGNQMVKNYYGVVLGTYDKKSNLTKDFYGRIIAKGNSLAGLLYK